MEPVDNRWWFILFLYSSLFGTFAWYLIDHQFNVKATPFEKKFENSNFSHGCYPEHMVELNLSQVMQKGVVQMFQGTYITSRNCLYRLQITCHNKRLVVMTANEIIYEFGVTAEQFDTYHMKIDRRYTFGSRLVQSRRQDHISGFPYQVHESENICQLAQGERIYWNWDFTDNGGYRLCCYRVRFWSDLHDGFGCPDGDHDHDMLDLWENGSKIPLNAADRKYGREGTATSPCVGNRCICSACKLNELGDIDRESLQINPAEHTLPADYVKYGATVEYACTTDRSTRHQHRCERIDDDIDSLGRWTPERKKC